MRRAEATASALLIIITCCGGNAMLNYNMGSQSRSESHAIDYKSYFSKLPFYPTAFGSFSCNNQGIGDGTVFRSWKVLLRFVLRVPADSSEMCIRDRGILVFGVQFCPPLGVGDSLFLLPIEIPVSYTHLPSVPMLFSARRRSTWRAQHNSLRSISLR